jgi:hypothetical protein
MSAAQVLRQVEEVLRHAPQAADAFERVASSIERGAELFSRTHGGRKADRVRYVETAEDGPLVVLGDLRAVAYLARKDRRGHRPEMFVHDFERPYPSLCFRPESRDLVIVRSSSRYTVGDEGIER